MKLWRLFLAMYVLVLSGLPCEVFCSEETAPVVSQASVPVSGDHAHDENCSPFCLCATCPGFNIPQAPQLTRKALPQMPITGVVRTAYQPPRSFEVPGRIWQPPRLA